MDRKKDQQISRPTVGDLAEGPERSRMGWRPDIPRVDTKQEADYDSSARPAPLFHKTTRATQAAMAMAQPAI